MYFDLSTLEAGIGYKLLTACVTPRPIAWVVSQNREGRLNCAPFSFFNLLGDAPPCLVLGINVRPGGVLKHSTRNILETGEFVVNLVPFALLEPMNLTAIDAPDGVDELALAGLTTTPSEKVAPPRIAESPVALECRLMQKVETGPAQSALIAEILAMHIRDDAVLDAARGHVDAPALDLVGRSYGSEYLRAGERVQLERPRWKDQRPEADKP